MCGAGSQCHVLYEPCASQDSTSAKPVVGGVWALPGDPPPPLPEELLHADTAATNARQTTALASARIGNLLVERNASPVTPSERTSFAESDLDARGPATWLTNSLAMPDHYAATEKRAELVRAAKQLLHAQGFQRTTLADVARVAKVPLGNVYYYFKTKEATHRRHSMNDQVAR